MRTNPGRYVMPMFLAGPSYTSRSKHIHAQETVNWYPERSITFEGETFSLYPTAGLTRVTPAPTDGSWRGAIEFKGDAYFVSGSSFYKMDSDEVFTLIGTINTTTGFVSMASNGDQGDQLILVDGTDGWIYDGSTLTQIADVDFPANPVQVEFLDSYFIVVSGGTGQFYISALNDGTSWDALDFATAERSPDNLRGLIRTGRNLLLAGEDSLEIWSNTGGDFPFEAYSDGLIEVGTPSAWTLARHENTVMFLGRDKQTGLLSIMRMDGNRLSRVSNLGVSLAINGYSKVDDAFGFIFSENNHVFYQITFPTANVTWVYDLEMTNVDTAWHQRKSGTDAQLAGIHLFFNGKNYIGARQNEKLYYLDPEAYTEDGMTITRTRVAGHQDLNELRLTYYSVEFDVESGTGITSGQADNPKLMVDWSDDGGYTWSNKRYLEIGGTGEYGKRKRIVGLGTSRDRLFRIQFSDPVPCSIDKAYAIVRQRGH